MNYFHMSYKEVIKSPMQRLMMLSKSIPKYEPKEEKEKETGNIFDFVKNNNLLKD